jgi:luciferase family oxidoreductase group 1
VSGEKLIEGHPFRDVRAQPAGPGVPEVWILGSSDYGAQVAAYFGLPFCFAHFISEGRGAAEALAIYRENFRPSQRLPAPHGAICVWAMAAETQEDAAYHFRSREIWRLNRDRGLFTALVSPEEAANQDLSEAETATIERLRARSFYGSPDVVASKLRALALEHGVDEVAILTTLHDPEVRRQSYMLLARAFGLWAPDATLVSE